MSGRQRTATPFPRERHPRTMSPDDSHVDPADAVAACRLAGVPELLGADPPAPAAVRAVGDGVNDAFVVPLGDGVVVKFATYSTAAHLRGGVAAARVLGRYTDLPVPVVHAFAESPVDLPPFVVLEHLPGAPLAADFADPRATAPEAVRLLGAVVAAFGDIPADAAAGYGTVRDLDHGPAGPRLVAEAEDCADWLVDYGTRYLADPPDHDALATAAGRAADHLRANRDGLPTDPDPAVVLTDLSPGNLLAPDGTPPADPAGLTGVVDLERAKVGPPAFTAVNAEYLLTRDVGDPAPVREALYEPLPFGPDVACRDCYRLVALARSVAALPAWYEPGSERFRERAEAVAAELNRLVP